MTKKINIGVIGAGYVGLVSAASFAEFGFNVLCMDKDEQKLSALQAGKTPIYEPGLENLINKNSVEKRLQFTSSLKDIVQRSDVIFVAVGTPTCMIERRPDLRYVTEVAKELAPLLSADRKVIVLKSTVPVGSCRHFANLIRTLNERVNIEVVSNPEFLREGSALYDFFNPDRIIIGVEQECSQKIMDILYEPLIHKEIPVLYTDLETSEMIKYASNSFLATKIAFINELSDFCETMGADIEKIALGMGLDKRIGEKYLQVGPGYGGSCFPKDTIALAYQAKIVDNPLTIIETVIASNENRKQKMIEKIILACGGSVSGKKLAVLGVAFKANTDDIRDSAAVTIIQGLMENKAEVTVYDPVVKNKSKEILPKVIWAEGCYSAIEGADAIVILTEWQEFKDLDLQKVKEQFNSKPIIIDLRNLYDPKRMALMGIDYYSVGRKPSFVSYVEREVLIL